MIATTNEEKVSAATHLKGAANRYFLQRYHKSFSKESAVPKKGTRTKISRRKCPRLKVPGKEEVGFAAGESSPHR